MLKAQSILWSAWTSNLPASINCISIVAKVSVALILIVSHTYATNLEDELRITLEQKHAIDKLRQRVLPFITEAYMKEDLHLIRWLRATDFNVDEAQRRLLENIKWRKQSGIETIDKEDFSDLEDDYPYFYTVDKQEQPVFIGYAGEWDVRSAALTGRAPRVIRYLNKALEQGAKRIRELQHEGKNVTRLNLLIDLGNFNIRQHGCVPCLFRILDFLMIYDNHYPGLADRAIFINTPPTVAAAADLVRSNAHSETMKAIKLYGRDRNVWTKVLLEFIDKDKLPEELGGTMKLGRKKVDQ